jgi:hypothetical protein
MAKEKRLNPNEIRKMTNKNVTCACMSLVDSAPAIAASDERTKAV